ncbi:hypothetical protein [Microcystis phage Mel-JY34]
MRTFLQLHSLQEVHGVCCMYGLAYKFPHARDVAAYFQCSVRSIQRLRKRIRKGEYACAKKPTCFRSLPID